MTFPIEANITALDAVGAWITSTYPTARQLTDEELSLFDRYSVGWKLPSPVEQVSQQWLLFDKEFPYSMPRVSIRGNADSMLWPHVERNGLLCLAGDGATVSTLEPIAVVQSVLHEAQCLLKENATGLHTEDFQEDFKAYWRRSTQPNQAEIRFQLRHEGPSRLVAAWHGEKFYLVAENSQSALRWMENRFGSDEARATHTAALIWLNSLPSPSQYPTSCNALRNLIGKTSDDGLKIFDQLIAAEPSCATVLLVGKSPAGRTASFGATIQRPPRIVRGKRRGAYPFAKGFRPGKVPAKVLSTHYGFERAVVVDVDSSRTRMAPSLLSSLEDKSVTVIGCGSLGSSVAHLLAKTGVRKLHLIDPESVGWENICRHELGASAVGKNKASCLAKQIKACIPQIKECSYSEMRWANAYEKNEKLFRDSDLVISTSGDWNSESGLNDICRAGEVTCPILYGWMEAQVGAAHALVVGADKGCLRCGFDDTGSPLTAATLWNSDPDLHGCGGGTSIYGAIELSQAAAMVSQLAVDTLLGKTTLPVWRTWLAPKIDVYSNGGLWNPEWKKRYGDPGNGGYLTANPWPEKKTCACKQEADDDL